MKRRIDDPELAKRIEKLIEIAGNKNRLAVMSGLTSTTISDLETGTSEPGMRTIVSLSRATGVTVHWLATGEGPIMQEETAASPYSVHDDVRGYGGHGDDYVFIPVVQGKISAGGGLVPDNNVEFKAAFEKNWIARKGDYKNMSLIRILGDSMVPTLLDGDIVLVNHNVKRVAASGGIYALTFHDEIIVKRIEVLYSSGQWKIRSDNPEYESFTVDPDQVIINGKVIWYARSLER